MLTRAATGDTIDCIPATRQPRKDGPPSVAGLCSSRQNAGRSSLSWRDLITSRDVALVFSNPFFCFHSHPAGLVRYRIRSTAASFILTRTFVPFLFSLVWLALTIDGSNSSSRRFLLHVVDHTYLHFLRK